MNARLLASIKSSDLHPSSDRRHSDRKLCRVSALLQVEGCAPMRVKTLDLSTNGIGLLLPLALPHGTVCNMHFHVHVNGLLREFRAQIQIANIVFLCSDVRAGCRFLLLEEQSRKILEEFMR